MAMFSSPVEVGDEMESAQMNELRHDILTQVGEYVVSTGSANAYILTIDENDDAAHASQITSILEGHKFYFKANFSNTDACTLRIDTASGTIKAATDMRDALDVALTADAIVSGNLIQAWFDGTRFRILNITLYKASQAEAEAGTNDDKYMTPLKTKQASVKSVLTTVLGETILNSMLGGYSTRFDITNPSGSTFRYTFDGSGADPIINASTFPVGTVFAILSTTFSAGNNGTFTVTASGNNYIEVTNPSGVAEANKTLATMGNYPWYFYILGRNYTYNKATNSKNIKIRLQGAGASGVSSIDDLGGNGGGYAEKNFDSDDLTNPILIYLNRGGISIQTGASTYVVGNGLASTFATVSCPANGEIPTGGDINIKGKITLPRDSDTPMYSRRGADSMFGNGGYQSGQDATGFGSGGWGSGAASTISGSGTNALLIIEESI